MPVSGATGPSGVSAITSTGGATGPISCGAFKNDATLAKLATGAVPPLAKGAPKSESVKTAQAALFSLGFIKARTGIDGQFGPGTEAAVKAFQASAGVVQSGQIDSATLKAMDRAAMTQIAGLKKQTLPDGSKRGQYHVVADISDPAKTRLYVLNKDNTVAAKYLTSPGRAEFPTQGDKFTAPDLFVRKQWTPPNSGWAANAKPIPPGIDNPMGLAKLSLGNYAQYIHGIPASEEAELGHAASHGCLRVSGSNILELTEKYAEAGTSITINRDRTQSAKLATAATTAQVGDKPTDAGREYLFGYLSGELGKSVHFGS
jgi:peptidoglycan hydrolase-like protein with peptidoglycan-binding domain